MWRFASVHQLLAAGLQEWGTLSCLWILLQVVADFDAGGGAARLAGGDPTLQRHLAAAAHLEAAAVEQAYGDVKAAETHLAAAEVALGLSMELTGELNRIKLPDTRCCKSLENRIVLTWCAMQHTGCI
jgi:hypothetical protein